MHPSFSNSAVLIFLAIIIGCSKQPTTASNTLFTKLPSTKTNIHFTNKVQENLYFNFINYSYIYNGAGVAVGDINNDGLEDLYFSSNQESNKLYLNKGDFRFEDITINAKVKDQNGWTTGVSMIDINNDGWLDIYVCKSGSLDSHANRKNKLYINQQNNTFKESASKYGLDHYGFSTQAYFFDFDNDGDLDMYLVNHRQDFRNNVHIDPSIQLKKEDYNSDQLFRNDGNKFTNITKLAGITNKAWGLSAAIGDFNNDNLLDIYVANDFLEPDFLYINQGNGTFKDKALEHFNHISSNSMGSDFADLNNDLLPDLVVLDMMAEDHIRGKENMATMSISNFHKLVDMGYHHQYMSNVLQLNNGNGSYSEISSLSGMAKTDWSWAPLIADFDNDGFNDVFVTNGIQHDLSNQDFRNQMKTNIRNRKKVTLEEAINMMPTHKLSNYSFKNNRDLSFNNSTTSWGLDAKVNSNGAVYADLDNDGDLDLVINNQGEKAGVYQNNSKHNFIAFNLKGGANNSFGIGTTVTVYANQLQQSKTHFVSRGFQSSIGNKLHFGLENISKIDSVLVNWTSNSSQKLVHIDINKIHTLHIKNAKTTQKTTAVENSLFEKINPTDIGIQYHQQENNFDDFSLQLLLPQKQSVMSSTIAVADINNDGLEDFFVGNATGTPASIFVQKTDGTFIKTNKALLLSDKNYEDTDAQFIDIDNDNDVDLYVSSGGYELSSNNPLLQDRIYINNGNGHFEKSTLPLFKSNTKGIAYTDLNKDGNLEIFVGGSVKNRQYPLAEKPFLLEYINGKFVNNIEKIIDDYSSLSIVKDAVFSDFDNDGDQDLLVVGEWMPITVFENKQGKLYKKELPSLIQSNGWYQTIKAADIDKDGDVDYIVGNWGLNNKFHPTKEKPLHIYADFFDNNASFDMALSKVSKTGTLLPVRGKECSTQQTPFLNQKLTTFKDFAAATMPDIYGSEKLANAHHFEAHDFASIILKNKGNGQFEIQELPTLSQFSPTLGIEIADLNNDGYLDIFGVGNIYDAEVETIRYDASKGYVLLGSEKGSFSASKDKSYFTNKEAKDVKKIHINGILHFIILNKNSELTILKSNNAAPL